MSSINQKAPAANLPRTHEGAIARSIMPEQELYRAVLACLLWEDSFYESGVDIVDRIIGLVPKVAPEKVMNLARIARTDFNLRHVPLLLARELARGGANVKELLASTIQRPDELTEFLTLYWQGGKCSIDNSVKKGLALAFRKFDEYQLAKYNRTDKAIKLKDILFLSHAKPRDKEQEDLWKRLIADELKTPDTWEVALSTGKNKKETWERLMHEGKLGGMALLRNLRNMEQANVDRSLIKNAILGMNTRRILPFRFVAAARYAPSFEPEIEKAFLKSYEDRPKFPKKAIVLVDVSWSMDLKISSKSGMNRIDAACAIAMIAKEMFEDVRVFSFSHILQEVAPRRGFALRDAIFNSQPHGGTLLGQAVSVLNDKIIPQDKRDLLLVFTDEQSHDQVPNPKVKGYMINVAAYKNGVGYGAWNHVDGFSEAVMTWIAKSETPIAY